jgi:MoaA/NifB/PqqE/SkfB family radical SAM enzyme
MPPSIYDQYALDVLPDVVIDTTYACNVMCKMCHLYSPDFKIPKSPHISFDLISRMIPLFQKARSVFLLGYGEPLMHPKIYDIVSLIKTKCPNTHLSFVSNGLLLTQRNIEKLINAHLDQINISLDGPNLERGHPKAEVAYAALRRLAAEKKRRGITYPAIRIGFVIGKDNEDELLPVLELGCEVGIVGIFITPLRIVAPIPEWDDYIRKNSIYEHLDTIVPILQRAKKVAAEHNIEITTPIFSGS